uniref:Uncharacterized protein n=1 Tax=Rhizophora mucronata TaxID=61149 RepID=A0A2P2R4G1_RHIMU
MCKLYQIFRCNWQNDVIHIWFHNEIEKQRKQREQNKTHSLLNFQLEP